MLWTIEAEDDFSYGYKAGRGRERLFRAVLGHAAKTLARRGADPAEESARAKRHLALLEERYPAHLERTRGLARALGMEAREVATGELALASTAATGCTNFAAVPPATSDGRVYVSWNFDLPPWVRTIVGRMPL